MHGSRGEDFETGFVLHSWPYQETSQLIEMLTEHHGRIGVVARGARRPASRWRSILQPFQVLRVSWGGRGALYTLHSAESAGWQPALGTAAMMAGFYVNELLLAFLRRGDAHPRLFHDYADTLAGLRASVETEPVLRRFEIRLLAEIGYGLTLDHDAGTERPLDPAGRYEYIIERGPVAVTGGDGKLVFSGAELLGVSRMAFDEPAVRRSAKRLLRAVLAHYLDGRSLRTRQVLAAMRR